MRILFLAPQPFFEERGTPFNVRLMLMALSELGHTVDILAFPHGADVAIPNVSIHRVWQTPGLGKAPIGPSKTKIAYDALMMAKATMMAFTNKYDVVHAVEESVFIARLLKMFFGIPYVYDMDSHMSDQLKYSGFFKDGPLLSAFGKMETDALKKASSVITVCKYLTDAAAKYVDPSIIHQIEDIPLDSPPPPQGITVETVRRDIHIPENAPIAVYTGNLEKYQGIDLLLESAAEVATVMPEARFVIVGGDAASIAKYTSAARVLGIGRNVIFTGPKPVELMALYYQMADVLLSPRIEGTNTPLKIYTYLKTGKPVAATDLPVHTQALTRQIAVLARPEKVEYASAILLLLKSKELREEIGGRGKEFVERNFNYDVFKRKTAEAYAGFPAPSGQGDVSPPL
ncbi:MAG: glycosyltransferase family 4 protein [Nitrospinae bacterium]|nr:glycosyltransferase family 4 protein [Nitrospinota bacterium]